MTTGALAHGPVGFGSARPRAGLLRCLEALALTYVLMISSGMFGFVDVLTFGDLYDKQAESPFAAVLWPIAYLLFAGLTVVVWREVVGVTRSNLWVLAFPLAVGASLLWSKDFDSTLGGAIRIGMTTLIGIYLGTRFDLQGLGKGVFLVMLLAVGASVLSALGGLGFALMEDGTVRGVFHHKNTLGSRAALLFGTGLALLIAGWQPLLAISGLGCALLAAVISQSATSVALAGLCLIILPIAVVLRARWSTLLYALILLGALVSLIAFLIVFHRINPVVEILTALGRDLTFTGRILLWEAAFDYVQARPLFGTGFDAFWGERLDWRILVVMEELGNILHFHNSFLEVAVTLGAAGLAAVTVTLAGFGQAALMALRLRVDPLSIWPTIFAAVLFAVAMVEVEVFVQHKILPWRQLMATIQHDLRAASAVTVRALPLVALLFAVGCNTPQAAVPVQTEFDDHADGFEASDGWVNGEQNGCGWRRQNASIEDGTLTLAIDDRRSRGRNFSCGEYRTTEHHGFGYYETRARVQPADGTVTAFFTYTGEPFGDPHDEIDFEWLGRDTTQVQLNYFVDGQGRHERMIDLGFDAAADFHVYGFEWRPDRVSWYVDCKLVHEVTSADGPLPRAAGRIYVHLWNGARSVRGWLGQFAYDGEPVRSTFDYLRHVPGGTHESSSSCAGGETHGAALDATAPVRPIEAPEAAPMVPGDDSAVAGPAPSPEDRSARPDAAHGAELPVEAAAGVSETSGSSLAQAEESATSPNGGEPIPLGAFGADRR